MEPTTKLMRKGSTNNPILVFQSAKNKPLQHIVHLSDSLAAVLFQCMNERSRKCIENILLTNSLHSMRYIETLESGTGIQKLGDLISSNISNHSNIVEPMEQGTAATKTKTGLGLHWRWTGD